MHVVVNAAISVDGKLSSRRREQIAISGPDDFARVDDLRAESDAIMVGVGTVLADDPHLVVDDSEPGPDGESIDSASRPARVVADSRARTPTDASILDDAAPTSVLVSETASTGGIAALESAGATVISTPGERVDLVVGLTELEAHGVERLMVEGGGELLFSLFEAGLVDELSVFVGSSIIGGRDAPTLADGRGFTDEFPAMTLDTVERIDDGVLLHYRT